MIAGYYWAMLNDADEREVISVDDDGEIRRTGTDFCWNVSDGAWTFMAGPIEMPDRDARL